MLAGAIGGPVRVRLRPSYPRRSCGEPESRLELDDGLIFVRRSGQFPLGYLEADAVAGTTTSGLNLGLLRCGIQQADALQLVSQTCTIWGVDPRYGRIARAGVAAEAAAGEHRLAWC